MAWNKRPRPDLAEQPEKIYPAALAYLSRRDYGREELARRLKQRGAEPTPLAEAMARLEDLGYIDDRRFAAGRVRQRRLFGRRGRSAIRQELRELGLDPELIEEALEEEYDNAAESQRLRELISAELELSPLPGEPEQRRRAMRSLIRRMAGRGFPPGEVCQAVSEAAAGAEEEF